MIEAEPYSDPLCHHGEGAVWDADSGRLLFVDMIAGDVLVDRAGVITRHHVGEVAAAVRPRRTGGYVVALDRRFALTDDDLICERVLPDVWDGSDVRFNDGGCDPQGRFYCGSMAYDARPGGAAMYRLDPTGSVHRIMTGLTVSNGLCWSPDGSVAYYVDTATQAVDSLGFDPAAGTFTDRRTVARIDQVDGSPDGLTVDSEGRIWVALWDGHAVHCYQPDGSLVEKISVPVARVTSCTFGGTDLDELYITTSRFGLDDPEPVAGAVFRCRPGVRGRPTATFAG
jgi:sugar lactone lactonase YvrE